MTSQYGSHALRAGLAKLYALYACTRPRARKFSHTGQYVILITFPRQQWFCERASILRYTMYIACLV